MQRFLENPECLDNFKVSYLEEDGEWVAFFTDLPEISAFGNSPEEAYKELKIAWEAVKESYVSMGEVVPSPAQKENCLKKGHC